jgi:hypothetical protein
MHGETVKLQQEIAVVTKLLVHLQARLVKNTERQ